MRLILLIALLLAPIISTNAAPVTISGGRITEQYDGSQLVFDLNAHATHKGYFLHNPPRYVVDISNAELTVPLNTTQLRSMDVLRVRTGKQSNQDLRIVMDLRAPIRCETTLIYDRGYRLVVDFYRPMLRIPKPRQPQITLQSTPRQTLQPDDLISIAPQTPAPTTPAPKPAISAPKPTQSKPQAKPDPIPRKRYTPIVIGIDAGHGGKWPGAVGPKGTREKDITLQISKRLAKLVNQRKGMRACLIRKHDKHFNAKLYRDLAHRIRITREQCHAQLFVSIHADAYTQDAQGASVYVLSKNASSNAARWLARNQTYKHGKDAVFDVEDAELQKILFDMVRDVVLVESRQLASSVLTQLDKVGKLHSRRVESANFAILKAPDIPSILVETAFISNPQEERKLRNSQYQQKLAKAILQGIRHYLQQRPQLWPVGVTFAKN